MISRYPVSLNRPPYTKNTPGGLFSITCMYNCWPCRSHILPMWANTASSNLIGSHNRGMRTTKEVRIIATPQPQPSLDFGGMHCPGLAYCTMASERPSLA